MNNSNFNFGDFLVSCSYANEMDDTSCSRAPTVVQELRDYEFPGGFRFFDCDMVMNDYYIEKVIYNNPATVVIWSDGTKTVSKTHADDKYSPEVGLVLCVLKKISGSTKVHDLIEAWVPQNGENVVSVSDVRKRQRGTKCSV